MDTKKMCIDLVQIAYVKRTGMHVVPRSTHDSFIVDVYIVWIRKINKIVVYIHLWIVCMLQNDNELIRFNASGYMCCFYLNVYHSMDCLRYYRAYTVFIAPIPRIRMMCFSCLSLFQRIWLLYASQVPPYAYLHEMKYKYVGSIMISIDLFSLFSLSTLDVAVSYLSHV